ncbi:MAG: flagellar basal-body rod protein FlgG [SAR324 cluster bacterium]|nr:flagellar basal-body rod protein FlgG [SAR324 cluster bacterium]MCZ6532844.1 flagellar basal-body rod protein FlgG [SAR324 cluster bacterium]MCZ6556361.1 flagellar basal-body rod protein FlgG [SAR324 cluster bacterium]MCZ6627854.1 flagellar basal-body rod protein FlgG [SAR324 cluster bacterium]MCZ6645435.1 flagellar basal-body rod protein FlgG [SAR324 cluster bacterium]
MMRSLFVSATGMGAQQRQIDTVANNLANVATVGFKKSRNNFQDLLYQIDRAAGSPSSQNTTIPVGIHSGHGVKHVSTEKIFTQGDMRNTGVELDVAIEGVGFFQILQPNGAIAYSRAGNYQRDAQGRIVTQDGFPLEPELIVPQDARQVQIGLDGTVSVLVGEETLPTPIGTLQLARFVNPAGLAPLGKNLFSPTAASGNAVVENPGINGMGTLNQYFLEISNVSVVDEMVNMIIAQRAYEVNSKAIQTSDEMLQTANQIIR